MDFEGFYVAWYSRAKGFAREYVMSESDAENIVQDVFLRLYERHQTMPFHTNAVAYLFTAIKNQCLDFLRQRTSYTAATKAMKSDIDLELRMKRDSLEALNVAFSDEEDIQEVLRRAVEKLPEKCRQILIMNKIEGKRQRVIAEELGISINTVESQITIAYRKLREELRDYIPLLLFFLASC